MPAATESVPVSLDDVPRRIGRKTPLDAAIVAGIITAAVAAGPVGCCKYQVNAFAPDKSELCPGETTTLRWNVTGPAKLKAERSEADWDEQVVPSTGERVFSETTSTTFTLTATKQNPAQGNYKVVTAAVASNGPRGGIVRCNAGLCTASLKPDVASIRVSRLSHPTMTVGGRDQDVKICVSHEGMEKTCVEPGQSAAVAVAFGGPWTLEATEVAGAPAPQKLALSFDFNCAAK